MADENTGKLKQIVKLVPIEWPEVGVALYANQLIVQNDGVSAYLTFCQTSPLRIMGSPEEQQAQLEQIKGMKALPVAQLVIPLGTFRQMLQIMQENLTLLDSRIKDDVTATRHG
jgi:hypothetical protein